MRTESLEDRVEQLVLEYAQSVPAARPLDRKLDLRNDLVLESLSLVSLAVRLGEELGVDIVDLGLELGDVKTLGDLMTMAHIIARTKTQEPQTGATP